MIIRKTTALQALAPNAEWVIRGEEIEWLSPDIPEPSKEQIQAKLNELIAYEPMRMLKEERNKRIAATDWRFRSDLTPSQAWIDYCQALRDLPENSDPQLDENGQLTNVNWPVEPAE